MTATATIKKNKPPSIKVQKSHHAPSWWRQSKTEQNKKPKRQKRSMSPGQSCFSLLFTNTASFTSMSARCTILVRLLNAWKKRANACATKRLSAMPVAAPMLLPTLYVCMTHLWRKTHWCQSTFRLEPCPFVGLDSILYLPCTKINNAGESIIE